VIRHHFALKRHLLRASLNAHKPANALSRSIALFNSPTISHLLHDMSPASVGNVHVRLRLITPQKGLAYPCIARLMADMMNACVAHNNREHKRFAAQRIIRERPVQIGAQLCNIRCTSTATQPRLFVPASPIFPERM
jgi:hypothetical protein